MSENESPVEPDSQFGVCPVCTDQNLEQIENRGVVFTGCAECFGLFVTEERLGDFVVSYSGQEELRKGYEDLLDTAKAGKANESKRRKCPRCEKNLLRFGFGESPFVILDRCGDDHGVWLDKKELKKVVRSSRGHAAVMGLIDPAHGDDDDDEDE